MKAEIDMPVTIRELAVEVVILGRRRTAVRIWLGCKLMIVAAFVMGCDVSVEVLS